MKTPANQNSASGNTSHAAGPRPSGKHCSPKIIDNSCVMCGTEYIESGRILHGHCVCEECVGYIIHDAGKENADSRGVSIPKRPSLEGR